MSGIYGSDGLPVPDALRQTLWSDAGSCANCGRPISEFPDVGLYIHLGPTGFKSSVGCRAASFDWNDQKRWDDDLVKHWKAKPLRRGAKPRRPV